MQNKRYTFSKSQRLLKPAEYQQVFDQQQKLYYQGLVLYFRNNNLSYSRLGLVVAKRHFRKAVTRNYIKRRTRESFRLNQHKLLGKDIIIVATAKLIENKQWRQSTLLASKLAELWQRLAAQSSSV